MNLGKDFTKKAAFRQELQAAPRPAARQYPVELLPDPLGADPPDGRRLPPDGGQGPGSIVKPSVAAKRTARSIRR